MWERNGTGRSGGSARTPTEEDRGARQGPVSRTPSRRSAWPCGREEAAGGSVAGVEAQPRERSITADPFRPTAVAEENTASPPPRRAGRAAGRPQQVAADGVGGLVLAPETSAFGRSLDPSGAFALG